MLKRNPSLTEQVKSLIKKHILNNKFVTGRIPSETDLANELGVSRTTVRDALSRLEREGTIFRKQGAGTFINKASLQIKTRLEEIWSYTAMLEAHGYQPSTQIISAEVQLVDALMAAELNLAPTETELVIKKLFLADEQPVIFTINRVPTKMISRPYTAEAFHLPIYQFLGDYCQQHLTYYLSEIVPLVAPDWLTHALHLHPQTALICFEEVGYNQDNEPILKARSYFKDALFRLRLMRREA
jgi:GntR family transcriptional regulator